jgi:Domain of unknown function (DUF4386)
MFPTQPTAVVLETKPTTNGHATATVQTAKSKRTVDASQRRAEIVIAALFLLTALAAFPAAFALDPMLNAPDYLARIYPNRAALVLDALLWSINNIGIVFIAVFALPLLRKLDEALAVGYLASRIIEGTIMMVGIVATLLLIPLSQQFLEAGAPQNSWFQTLGDVLKQAKFLGLTGISLPLLGLGGCLFTWLLFRFRLVPRLIAVWGLIGYALIFVASFAGWFGLIDVSPGGNVPLLAIPVASFEIILLPIWLLFRGFKMPEERTLSTPPSASVQPARAEDRNAFVD